MADTREYTAWPRWLAPANEYDVPRKDLDVVPVMEGAIRPLTKQLVKYLSSRNAQGRLEQGQLLLMDIASSEWKGARRERNEPVRTHEDLVAAFVGMRLAPMIWEDPKRELYREPGDMTLPMAVAGWWGWPEGGSDALYEGDQYWPMPVSIFKVLLDDMDLSGSAQEAMMEEGAVLHLELVMLNPNHPDAIIRDAIREWGGENLEAP